MIRRPTSIHQYIFHIVEGCGLDKEILYIKSIRCIYSFTSHVKKAFMKRICI